MARDLNISSLDECTFITNKQKSILDIIRHLLARVAHILNKKHKELALEKLFWKVGRATRVHDFKQVMNKLHEVDKDVYI